MEMYGIGSYGAVSVLCYLIGSAAKAAGLDRYIPMICGAAGLLLGTAAYYLVPGFPGGDLLNAAAMGAVSGFAATGMDQSVKQLRG